MLPAEAQRVLDDFVAAARDAFSDHLRSVVLYGSGAEGRLRSVSDLNLILVLGEFDRGRADRLRAPLRVAHAAADLNVMFLLDREVAEAAAAFADKFGDIVARHKVLFGEDPFAKLAISQAAMRERVVQHLMNMELRLRSAYVSRGLREEQLGRLLAESAGPLRAAAATILQIEEGARPAPREALARIAKELGAEWRALAEHLSSVREGARLAPGAAGEDLFLLLELVRRLRERARKAP